MTDGNSRRTINYLSALFNDGVIGSRTDSQLVEQFLTHDREAAEPAFAVLVERHGPMVLRTGRTIVGDEHMAEDVFQATFLVLAMKAKRLRVKGSLGPWLHSVACRVAYSARSAAARRRRHERAASVPAAISSSDSYSAEWQSVLHEELDRLPDRYRHPILLCDMEGLTGEEAATRLNWPVGTLWSRLARGRQRLRERLTRRGITASVLPAIGNALRGQSSVPAELTRSTVRAALQGTAGSLPGEIISKSVVTLAHEVSTAMTARFLRNLTVAALLPVGCALIYLGSTHGASSKPPTTEANNKQRIDERILPLLGTWAYLYDNLPNESKDGIKIALLSADPSIARRLGFDAPFVCTLTRVNSGKSETKPSELLFVDPRTDPPQLTSQPLGSHPGDSSHLDGWLAVYRIDGDILRIHGPIRVGGSRPSGVDRGKNSETRLDTYQRIRKPPATKPRPAASSNARDQKPDKSEFGVNENLEQA